MPCHPVWKDTTLTLVFEGHVSTQEILHMEGNVHGDPRFEDVRYQLYDATAATSTDFSPEGAIENAYLDSVLNRVNQRHRTAFVGTEPAIVLAMTTYMRILDDLDPGIERRLFSRREDAVTWLFAVPAIDIGPGLMTARYSR